uniref:Transmembrane 9 superfamily member n=1 Tax=Physcomitrium patens TaxID=3218 RepID=A0A7I4C5J2_PHYPA
MGEGGGLMWQWFLVVATCCIASGVEGRVLLSAKDHRYKENDNVPLFANKVGPFHNPSETYQYYDLPFCKPDHFVHKSEGLGEVLEGDRMVNSRYNFTFKVDKSVEDLCTVKLSPADIVKFKKAVEQDYYFQMFFDDLPLQGFVGKMLEVENKEPRHMLFTHILFEVMYNDDRVIEISVRTDPKKAVDISEEKDTEVKFTYSTQWSPTAKPFEKRLEKYRKHSFLPKHLEIHWFSIINSCVTVLLLTGFLTTILMRVLKNDFIKYTNEDEEEHEETGWKYIHGDVFRFPPFPNLFSAVIGSGTQLLVLVFFIFGLSLVGVFYPYNRGALNTACLVIYALTAGVSGYVSAHLYRQMGGENWVLGGIAGKNNKAEFYAPCRTNKYPREIPALPWYRRTVPQMCMAGFLPFSAIYIELYYIFASVWGHKIYTIYSILFIVFIILIIVTAFITIALTYFQLAVEDHEWWWRSVFCGGSTGMFIYGYCFYYYHIRSGMVGLMQASFFYGYMGCVCYGFFLMLGSVGYRASLLFVRNIYRAIKCE